MYKSSKRLENTFLYEPQSAMKIFLKNFPRNWNLQSYNLYIINLKEHLFNNIEEYPSENLLFPEPKQQYHTKVYNISSILVWVSPNILNVFVSGPRFCLH